MGRNSEINQTASTDALGYYLHEIGQYPLLSKEQEFEIAQTYQAGVVASQQIENIVAENESIVSHEEYAELGLVALIGYKIYGDAIAAGKDAKKLMINSNLRLTVSIAKRYQHNGVELLDLIQEGNVGLDRAVEKFDPSKGFKFSTYATWWIRQGITRGIGNQGKTIRTPIHLHEKLVRLRKTEQKIKNDLGVIDDEAVCATLDISLDKLQELRSYSAQATTRSLNEPVGEDGQAEFGDRVADSSAEYTYQESDEQNVFEALWESIVNEEILDEREQEIIILRFGLFGKEPRTLEEVGVDYNLTRERIRQIESNAMTKIRTRLIYTQGQKIQDYIS